MTNVSTWLIQAPSSSNAMTIKMVPTNRVFLNAKMLVMENMFSWSLYPIESIVDRQESTIQVNLPRASKYQNVEVRIIIALHLI